MPKQQNQSISIKLNPADVEVFMQGMIYPATKREILDTAYDNGAPDHILEFLNVLPDQEYENLTEVMLTVEDEVAVR